MIVDFKPIIINDEKYRWMYAKYSFYVDSKIIVVNSKCLNLANEFDCEKNIALFLEILKELEKISGETKKIKEKAELIIEVMCG